MTVVPRKYMYINSPAPDNSSIWRLTECGFWPQTTLCVCGVCVCVCVCRSRKRLVEVRVALAADANYDGMTTADLVNQRAAEPEPVV